MKSNRYVVEMSLLTVGVWLALSGFGGEMDVSHGSTQTDEQPTKQTAATPAALHQGKAVYQHYCLPCHGLGGAGDGPVANTLNPRPRDFTQAHFKLRSTGFDQLPTNADLYRTISRGIPGTAMPAWKHRLSEQERWAVLYYIKTFSAKFKDAHPQTVSIGAEPSNSAESIARGKALFHDKGQCLNCHGDHGRGNGPFVEVEDILVDARGDPVMPRNLTEPWRYKGGNTVKEIVTRLSTGLNGTPMSPPTAPLDELSEAERWDLAHYVKSLQQSKQGAGQAVIRARKTEKDLSLDAQAEIWKSVPSLDVELTGQVHVAPRNENPDVDLIRVKAAYNDKELALWLQWDDRTENSDFESEPQKTAMLKAKFGQTYPVLYPAVDRMENLPDGVMVQWPVKIPEGPILPHMVQGDGDHPVNLWHWRADWQEDDDAHAVHEENVAGYKAPPKTQAATGQQSVGKGVFEDGRWTVVIKRPLRTKDAGDVQMEMGRLIPLAVNVWNGANEEFGLRRTVSSWYFILLEKAPSPMLYLLPLIGFALALGLELLAIRRARAKHPARKATG